jgi:uncharacterized protein (DUF2267 family)
MSSTGLESIDHTVEITHRWINELDGLFLGWGNKRKSYRLLRVVLQALRDWLPINESANLAAQLPNLLRGVYYEHWRPATTPLEHRSKADFLARMRAAFVDDPVMEGDEVVSVVFQFLSTKISAGEIEDVLQALPADLRALWPAPARPA